MNANKFIAGLGKEYFIHPDHVSEQGGAEKYLPQIERQVNIKMKYVDTKGGAEKHMPHLGKDWFFHPDHIEGGIVTFAMNKAGAKVTMGDKEVVALGKKATVTGLLLGEQSYTVELSGHTPVTGNVVMPQDSEEEITIELAAI